ncbi:DUF421 domain-containing protein [Ferviditalea candida]|uniref:YetF domain-containing protein n=1 Tax=Ferviditalea candida TaxID=3108399 RepID=A0ABU5ZNM6_9BACL|nr:YetF domain-containing protein [Paenibacillaceae bacterium T2]
MLIYIGKIILLFTITIIVIRFLGKSALAQLTPHDLTAIIFLATLAVNPILSDKLGQTLIGILMVTTLHFILSKLALLRWLNKLLIGQPTILVKNGKIIKSNLERSHFSLIELLATFRTGGYPNIQDIEYAILEPNSEISIIPKKDVVSLTPRHLKLDVDNKGLPISVVVEGKIQHNNLKIIDKDENWLMKQLESAGYPNVKKIFYAAVRDNDHSLIIDTGYEN